MRQEELLCIQEVNKMITFEEKGNFKKVDSFLEKLLEFGNFGFLDKYGRKGVQALADATPLDTGETRNSWKYEIVREGKGTVSLVFSNTHIEKGVNIAVILQYGHGTGTGGWVEGQDYINPAIQPIFEEILRECLKEIGR